MLAAIFGKKEDTASAFTASASGSNGEAKLSIIAEGTACRGDIETSGNLRIDGKIIGNIISTANVAIGKGGIVEGNIVAAMIKISGKVQGNLDVSNRLILDASAVVTGEIKSKLLSIDEGAIVNGTVTMTGHSSSDNPSSVEVSKKEYAQ